MSKKNTCIMYYFVALITIIAVPTILILVYDNFAGGVLRGLAGGYGGFDKLEVIDPDILLMVVNPVAMLVSYAAQVFFYVKCVRADKRLRNVLPASFILVLASIVVLLGVLWKVLTT